MRVIHDNFRLDRLSQRLIHLQRPGELEWQCETDASTGGGETL